MATEVSTATTFYRTYVVVEYVAGQQRHVYCAGDDHPQGGISIYDDAAAAYIQPAQGQQLDIPVNRGSTLFLYGC